MHMLSSSGSVTGKGLRSMANGRSRSEVIVFFE
jgi:hypothetical protein